MIHDRSVPLAQTQDPALLWCGVIFYLLAQIFDTRYSAILLRIIHSASTHGLTPRGDTGESQLWLAVLNTCTAICKACKPSPSWRQCSLSNIRRPRDPPTNSPRALLQNVSCFTSHRERTRSALLCTIALQSSSGERVVPDLQTATGVSLPLTVHNRCQMGAHGTEAQ